jgi:uncharacterized repeat protein (TIGR03803 family)
VGPFLSRYALSMGAAAALLVGCAGAQPPGALGAVPQTSATAPPRSTMRNIRTASSAYQMLLSFNGANGAQPEASLIDVNGTLYGTTFDGGRCRYPHGAGTVFSITTKGTEQVLHFFKGGSDGLFPDAGLIVAGGVLYGTTQFAGAYCEGSCLYGCGTVFSISTSGIERVLHSFGSGSDGARPVGSLIDVDGTLYRTTVYGGAYCKGHGDRGCGTVFSITRNGTEHVLHSFGSGSDGAAPLASLIDVNGTLYGTTFEGGARPREQSSASVRPAPSACCTVSAHAQMANTPRRI